MHLSPRETAAHGRARSSTPLTFISGAALDSGVLNPLGLSKRLAAVRNARGISKRDLLWNDAFPKIEVLRCEPAEVLPLAQRYFLF
jgi:urease subunit alpha